MPNIKEGSFELNLGIFKLGGKLVEEDRQCAWELYTEIATRVAVVGKRGDAECKDFNGELYSDSLDSIYSFFRECRGIMRSFPVGKIAGKGEEHLGVLISRIFSGVLRPFLEKWNGKYRHWFQQHMKPDFSPYDVQKSFPDREAFLKDWSDVRKIMRAVEKQLQEQYKLVPLG